MEGSLSERLVMGWGGLEEWDSEVEARRLWRASSRPESKERPPLKCSESGEGGRECEETGDPGVVLDPRGDKAKKGKVLGAPKRSGSSLNPNLTGHPSGGEEGGLEAG